MTELQWSSKMNIGIDVIDKQHRQIVDYINRLGEAIKASNKSEILQILDDVIDYTQSHFAFEEAHRAMSVSSSPPARARRRKQLFTNDSYLRHNPAMLP